MTCPYGCKFDATICMMRHNSAIKRMDNPELYDGDERDDYCMCYDCNAVKCFIKYRERIFENHEKSMVEEQKQNQKNPNSVRDKYGRTIIAFGKRGNKAKQMGVTKTVNNKLNIDPYILDRFVRTYEIIKENNIKTYDELIRFVQYKTKSSIYIYIRDNRKGLEILFKNNPLQE